MKLDFFKTLWGWPGSWREALHEAAAAGFAGIEGPLPAAREGFEEATRSLRDSGLPWIAEISTTGYAVPEAGADVARHLEVLRREVERALPLKPRFFTSMAGDDCWAVSQSVGFFGQVLEVAREFEVTICCETHRGRSLFHPRVTKEILQQLPELELTADFSHWCNVCERLVLAEYPEFLECCRNRVRHIHARVGYDQGAQVPHPLLPRYREPLEQHLGWWMQILQTRCEAGAESFSLTPEFGPDGYQQIEASTDQPYGDLWEINTTMARLVAERWQKTSTSLG
jgi:sugar phosphate isomerase/epimerase